MSRDTHCSYSWIIRWRADYRPDTPLPPLHHAFWDEMGGGGGGGRGLEGGGWWDWGWGDNGGGSGGDLGVGASGAFAAVYVPFVPGSNRVFTHVSDGGGGGGGLCSNHFDITSHTSHVTRHTSHVTRHTSHVTRDALTLARITRGPLPIS